jgi:hypothetical protein
LRSRYASARLEMAESRIRFTANYKLQIANRDSHFQEVRMRGVYWTISLVLIATASLAQTQQPNQLASASGATAQEPGTRGSAAVSTGERTIVGCVAVGSPGYVLKTEDGRTLPLRGATDLSSYMGKRVQIHASWTSKGVHVAAPLEAAETPAAAPASGAPVSQEFAGDIHLQFAGKVLGDCLGKKK